MKYTNEYLLSHDIDWFFFINKKYIHVASAGGIIPEQINDIDKLRNIQRKVFELPSIFEEGEIILNEAFLDNRFNNKIYGEHQRSNYLRSFMDMSRKGFISLDRTNLNNWEDNTYHIVCMPPKHNSLEELQEIFKVELLEEPFNEPIGNIKLLELF